MKANSPMAEEHEKLKVKKSLNKKPNTVSRKSENSATSKQANSKPINTIDKYVSHLDQTAFQASDPTKHTFLGVNNLHDKNSQQEHSDITTPANEKVETVVNSDDEFIDQIERPELVSLDNSISPLTDNRNLEQFQTPSETLRFPPEFQRISMSIPEQQKRKRNSNSEETSPSLPLTKASKININTQSQDFPSENLLEYVKATHNCCNELVPFVNKLSETINELVMWKKEKTIFMNLMFDKIEEQEKTITNLKQTINEHEKEFNSRPSPTDYDDRIRQARIIRELRKSPTQTQNLMTQDLVSKSVNSNVNNEDNDEVFHHNNNNMNAGIRSNQANNAARRSNRSISFNSDIDDRDDRLNSLASVTDIASERESDFSPRRNRRKGNKRNYVNNYKDHKNNEKEFDPNFLQRITKKFSKQMEVEISKQLGIKIPYRQQQNISNGNVRTFANVG